MSSEFPRYVLSGEPREIGYQHGAALGDAISDNVEVYFRLFEHYSGMRPREVLERAAGFIETITNFDRGLMDEIGGIAEGSRRSLEEIVALNARTEVMFKDGVRAAAECTSMAVTPEASSAGATLIGQNWDWMPRIQRNCVLLEIRQARHPKVLTFTEAGLVGKIGLNSAGLGLCCNLLVTPETRKGVPFHVLCRRVLNAGSLGEALGVLISSQSGASGNFLLAHAAGEAIDIEKTPNGAEYLYNGSGVLAHTNHFESRLAVTDQGRKLLPDSILRYCRANKLLAHKAGRIDLTALEAVMRDHVNRPNSICRHVDLSAQELDRLQTNASIIMNLNEGVMWIAKGGPCEADYEPEPLDRPERAVEMTVH